MFSVIYQKRPTRPEMYAHYSGSGKPWSDGSNGYVFDRDEDPNEYTALARAAEKARRAINEQRSRHSGHPHSDVPVLRATSGTGAPESGLDDAQRADLAVRAVSGVGGCASEQPDVSASWVLADAKLRSWRRRCHATFDQIWQIKARVDETDSKEARAAAYRWLADQLGLTKDKCHFGSFGIEMCKKAHEVCRVRLNEVQANWKAKQREAAMNARADRVAANVRAAGN